jgi:NAD(P)-dependent dehydrogenase (short-subunit alcohol dehydrogenase family)
MMERKKGSIVNIASIGAELGPVDAYGCAKASTLRFTRGAALDLAKYNIRVNAIQPGLTATERIQGTDPERLKHWRDLMPLGRFGEMEDIAACALFLASDASKSITGVSIRVDCGYLLGFMEHVEYLRR